MNNTVNIFYSSDDCYVPCMTVSIISLIKNSSNNRNYNIFILNDRINSENKAIVSSLATQNVKIEFVDVSQQLSTIAGELNLRDYYSISIYSRIFIPEMFKSFDRAIYLDADTVVLADIGDLYDTDLKGNLIAGVSDAVIASEPVFRDYATYGVGIEYKRYFNSGMMLMDLEGLRKFGLQAKFINLINTYNFATVCPDQDYLNVILKDRVLYLDSGWNKMSVDTSPCEKLNIIHFNMFFKPWYYKDVPYSEHFWHYAGKSVFYDKLKATQEDFGNDEINRDNVAGENLKAAVKDIINAPDNFRKTLFK